MGLPTNLFLDPRTPGAMEVENVSGRTVRLRVEANGRSNKVLMTNRDFEALDDACLALGGARIKGSPAVLAVKVEEAPETSKAPKTKKGSKGKKATEPESDPDADPDADPDPNEGDDNPKE